MKAIVDSFNRLGLQTLIIIGCAAVAATAPATPVQVRELTSADNAVYKHCPRCVTGDYRVTNGKLDVIIGASHRRDESFYKFPTADALGSIVSFKNAETMMNGDIMVGTPYIRVDNTTRHIRYDSVEILRGDERITFVATGKYNDQHGVHVQFIARVRLVSDADRVDISLTVTNIGETPIDNFIYALYFDPHQMYDFSPADFAAHRRFQFRGYPRENHLVAWVDRTARQSDASDYSFGWDGGMILPDPLAISLAPGASDSRQYVLFTGAEIGNVLRNVYRESGVATRPVFFDFTSDSSDYFEIVVRDAQSTAVFFRSFLDRPSPLAIELPLGTYRAEAKFFPGLAHCTLTVSATGSSRCEMQDSPHGQLSVRMVNSAGKSVPGKISFNGVPPTPTPYFRPENPTRDDGYWESHKNSVFPVNTERLVTLPVGAYLVSATMGPEFSLAQQTIEISANQSESLTLQIDRVIDRPDLISIDTHLHTLESDGSVTVAEKIRALVAAGINVAVATDHNFPVDYRPALYELGLQNDLIVAAGAEVTVPERLDYNTYPMVVRPDEYNHGAIDALSPDVSSRFRLSRKRDAEVIIQVNHPRFWQFDYFNWFGLDPQRAAFAYEGFDLDFDVLEVINGAIYETAENAAARKDWFNLLCRGYFFPLVGTSDSHEIDQDEPGFSRTYVYRGDAGGQPFPIEQLMQRLREGRSFASNGPILDLTAFEHFRPGDTVAATDGIARITVDVWTAPWIEADTVRIFVNGRPRSVPTHAIVDPTAKHYRATVELKLEQDSYVLAEVTGTKDLFPMLQRRLGTDGQETGVSPYALTNPIFIDVNGNGLFDPPLPHKIDIRPRSAGSRR